MKRERIRKTAGALSLALTVSFMCPGAAFAAQASPGVDLVIAADVADRQPVGESRTFPAGQEFVVAWTRVTGMAGSQVEHVWRYRDSEFVVPLDVGSPSWRTWSRKTIPAGWTGEWTVEIRDAGGNVLASTTFTVGQ